MGTRLVLIRHGESRAVADRVMGGHRSCRGLTDLGVRQAEALRDRWLRTDEVEADVVYASVLPRAIETARLVLPALGGHDVVEDCELCEIHMGEADELSWDEYEEKFGFSWSDEPQRPVAPGGESWASFQERVRTAVERLTTEHEGSSIVVFCHGGFIRNATRVLMRETSLRPEWSVFFENTSITEWVDGGDGRWRLVRLNDAAHLASVTAPAANT